MKLSFKGIIKPALILFAICAISVAALAGTNELTKNKIQEAAKEAAEATRMVVLPDAQEFEDGIDYSIGISNGETVGYVFETESKGYGGTIRVMTGINLDGKVTGVAILEHAETPGLGANAANPDFTDKYKGDAPKSGFSVGGGEETPSGDKETDKDTDAETAATEEDSSESTGADSRNIEAMTGATITTKAVTDAVNEAVSMFYNIAKRGV